MGILVIAAVVLCLIGLAFLCVLATFVLPIWSLVDIASSQNLGRNKKIGLIVGVGLSWTLGAIIYGIFVSVNRSLRRQASITGVCFLVALIAVPFLLQYANKAQPQTVSRTIARINRATLIDVTPKERAQMVQDLETLQREATGPWYRKRNEKDLLEDFLRFASELTSDRRLSGIELKDWRQYFDNRAIVDKQALKRHILSMQFDSLVKPTGPQSILAYKLDIEYPEILAERGPTALIKQYETDKALFFADNPSAKRSLPRVLVAVSDAYRNLGDYKNAAASMLLAAKHSMDDSADQVQKELESAEKLDPSNPEVAVLRQEFASKFAHAEGTADTSTAKALVAGRVTESTGSALPGVFIHAVADRGTQEINATTDASGRYTLRLPQDGSYRLETQLAGFSKQSRYITVQAGERRHEDFVLPVGK
jgi:hypothetical protein